MIVRRALLLVVCSAIVWPLIATSEDDVPTNAISEVPVTADDRDHWAFRPLLKPTVPEVSMPSPIRSPIDAFILEQLSTKQLGLAPEAERPTFLRRVTFDLTGFPPTAEELDDFLADTTPNAIERVVDRLLASPAYGERMAQHWLDLARFAETDGFEHDKVRPDAWQYRDWVIAAFNRDLPYSDFVVQQLAGDQLEPPVMVPTTFCLAGPDMPDVNDQLERRHFRLNELTGTVGAVFLGLQIGCAECHDHKYDPISQADFYRLRAVFEPAVPSLKRDAPYYSFRLTPPTNTSPARIWIRGDHRRPGPTIEAALPRIAIADSSVSSTSSDPGQRRLQFARQLVDGSTPLTARVIVNRLWQQHFQRGLCATGSDFGVINLGPTHPELLDWLACELIEQGWSLKALHRQIVLSATYRQTARRLPGDTDWDRRLQLDPAGEFLSRGLLRRLDGEQLRDALLMASSQFNDDRGGHGVRPPLPEELVQTLLKGQWVTSENAADHTRRSIYLFARRNLRYPLFEAFDRPDANASCPLRGRSTTAPQALALLNGELTHAAATALAATLLDRTADDAGRAVHLYRAVLSRSPSDAEVARLLQFVHQQQSTETADAAWTDAALAIFNSQEFVYLD
ncbi:DUF1553 domain-containing protein [bacterium]|nr:DUF1553 domain-containing protein [bacterium]